MFAKFVVGLTDEIGPIATVYAFDANTTQFGEVHPLDYAQYLTLPREPLSKALAAIPSNHFVWSDELIQSFSDYIDFCLDRETARSTGLHIRWAPDLKNCGSTLEECTDFSPLFEPAGAVNRMYCEDETWIITFGGITKHVQHQIGFRYIHYLLTHPVKPVSVQDLELIMEPGNAVSAGVERAQSNPSRTDADHGEDADWQADGGFDEDDTQEGVHEDEESMEQRNITDNDEGRHTVADANSEMEVTDEMSIKQYESEIAKNLKLIDNANSQGDNAKVVRLEMENAKIKKHLATVRNKNRGIRKANGDHEKRRKRISIAIARAENKVKEIHPAFAQHLRTHLQRGRDFYYKPAGAVSWSDKPPAIQ